MDADGKRRQFISPFPPQAFPPVHGGPQVRGEDGHGRQHADPACPQTNPRNKVQITTVSTMDMATQTVTTRWKILLKVWSVNSSCWVPSAKSDRVRLSMFMAASPRAKAGLEILHVADGWPHFPR
jgi:hypothetical protein